MNKWTRNTRCQNDRAPADRIRLVDEYLSANPGRRRRLLAKHRLAHQSIQGWAQAYFGQGLRALGRQLKKARP